MSVGLKGQGVAIVDINANLGSGSPGTVYIALFTGAPTATGGGTEVTGVAYARIGVANNRTTFPAATLTPIITNGIPFNFGTVGSGGWGTVIWFAIVYTASGALTASDIIYAGPLGTVRIMNAGDDARFNSNSLSVQEL